MKTKKAKTKKYRYVKMIDRYSACLWCRPVSFCGVRYTENPEVCYKCLEDAVKDYTKIRKIKLLAWLWLNSTWLSVCRLFYRTFHKKITFDDM